MSEGFLLTDLERDRFATWLERQAESSRGMLAQFEKLPPAIAELMVAKEKRELTAYIIVAQILRTSESVTVEATNEST